MRLTTEASSALMSPLASCALLSATIASCNYLTGEGIMVYNKEGRQIDRIRVPDERWTANASCGGNDGRTLFIMASTGLYAITMRVKGANAAK